MLNTVFKERIVRYILPKVQTPAQYVGGELNVVVKDHRTVRGRLCMAFPDLYTIGMSHHGLQVLYSLMNSQEDWACERAFAPAIDMERELRAAGLPLYSLETFTPLSEFDVLGFTLQYEICTSNILTMLDLAGIPLRSVDRTMEHPLVIAGGPCAQNPEPIAPFIDVFVTGDGEPSLPRICDEWLRLKSDVPLLNCHARRGPALGGNQAVEDGSTAHRPGNAVQNGESCSSAGEQWHRKESDVPLLDCHAGRGPAKEPGGNQAVEESSTAPGPGNAVHNGESCSSAGEQWHREELLARLAGRLPFAYVPRFYEPEYHDGKLIGVNRTRPDVPETIEPSVIDDLDAIPLPTKPVLPYVECVHDRIAIEIMRGCPWQCRFCQSTVIKRPLRVREVETIVQGALESYRNTGHHEISLLSLSTSDYPYFEELMRRMREVFEPLDVSVSIPSLRVNEQLQAVVDLMSTERHSGLTLAPEVARDDMREQIRKKIKNEDLYEGCRKAFANGFDHVKLYFLCGLPGERPVDLDGIVEMAETIATIGREMRGRYPKVTASVSNFVPKAHTPYQWNGMQTREYFHWARDYMKRQVKIKSVRVNCHPVETSMLEGLLSRGDRRVAEVVELAWRRGARLDSWMEHIRPELWWECARECGLDLETAIHTPCEIGGRLPWDHINVKKGRTFLEKEQQRATVQLAAMASAK